MLHVVIYCENKSLLCYSKNDVGKLSTPFRIRIQPNAQLMTQRPSKVHTQYRVNLNAFLNKLEKHNIFNQNGSSLHDKPTYGTTYPNPHTIIPEGESNYCVLDARHLESNPDHSDGSWPV